MARYDVAPTKTNFLRLRRDLAFAREGHGLLEQKRDILVAELFGLSERANRVQAEIDELLRKAFSSLEKAVAQMGRESVWAAAQAVSLKPEVRLTQRRVMGVFVPAVRTELESSFPYYSPGKMSLALDEAVMNFQEVLRQIGRLAETRIALGNLTREVKKTIRRVNALERIALPDYEDTLKYITDSLEETERETFYALKLIKTRLEAGRRMR